jgi:curved DNA-binding protein CbpA
MTSANERAHDQVATARSAALDLLGLPEHPGPAQILAAYRRLARATHPDATGRTDPAAGQGFVELHDAFELLTQPHRDEPHGEQPVGGPAEPAGPAESGTEPPARAAQPRPGTGWYGRVRTRRPIVAGPVIVTDPTGFPGDDHTDGVGNDH